MPPMNAMTGSTGPVFTSEMLTQALNAAQQHMTQTGQTLQAQLPENQNIQQAAHDVLSGTMAHILERFQHYSELYIPRPIDESGLVENPAGGIIFMSNFIRIKSTKNTLFRGCCPCGSSRAWNCAAS